MKALRAVAIGAAVTLGLAIVAAEGATIYELRQLQKEAATPPPFSEDEETIDRTYGEAKSAAEAAQNAADQSSIATNAALAAQQAADEARDAARERPY